MRRRALLRTLAALLLLLAGAGGVLIGLIRREPASYREVQLPDEPQRRKLSGEFASGVQQLLDSIVNNTEERWEKTFTAEQMNSYFVEDFVRVRPFKLPEGIHSPRVCIEPGKLQLAFRYGRGFWNSVVSVDMSVWLVANEANLVAVEVTGLHAGALPISMQSIQEQIAEAARQWNVDVTWYRHEGNPVALVRFQPDRPNPTVLLQRLELQTGRVVIEGKSTEGAPLKSMLSMKGN